MSGSTKSSLPACGLYLTTKPLAGHEEQFPAGLLVYFHNHSDSGSPAGARPRPQCAQSMALPRPGGRVSGLSWADGFVKMIAEGFYTLRRELSFDGGTWPKGALVQLGYTRNADPILFIGQVRTKLDENDLWFSDRGVGISRDQLSILDPSSSSKNRRGEGDHGPANVH